MKPIASILCLFLLSGCTFFRGSTDKATAKVSKNTTVIEEASRQNTTAVVDTLSRAPASPPVNLATEFARADQALEGLPLERIDVDAILSSNKVALVEHKTRMESQNQMLAERERLSAELAAAQSRLVEMGRLYEAEKNKGAVSRFFKSLVATLGIGGIIALLILVPALIPIFGSIVSAIVSKLPALAGYIGMVGKKSWDAVVKGVGETRKKLSETAESEPDKRFTAKEVLHMMDSNLRVATDEQRDHKLIDNTRSQLKV